VNWLFVVREACVVTHFMSSRIYNHTSVGMHLCVVIWKKGDHGNA
jgi:hypothetical protein